MSANVGTLLVEIGADVARLRADMGKAATIAQNEARKISKAFDVVGVSLASAFSVQTIASAAVAIYQAGSRAERLAMSMKAIEGNSAKAGDTLAWIRQESDKVGVSFMDTADAYKSMLAAGNASGMAAKDVRDLFSAVVEAGAVVGMSNEQQTRSLQALQQMISKGTVSSEELKQQLGENLPGAFAVAAKAAGMTTQQFSKMLESGGIMATDFLPKFAKAMREEFGASVEDAGNTGSAALNRLDNSWTQFKANVYNSEGVVNALDNVKAALDRVGGAGPKTKEAQDPIADLRAQAKALEDQIATWENVAAKWADVSGASGPARKVQELQGQLAAVNRELLNAQVALGKNVPDRAHMRTLDESSIKAREEAWKLENDMAEKALETQRKLTAARYETRIAQEEAGGGNPWKIKQLQQEREHLDKILGLRLELQKSKTDLTVDPAPIRAAMGEENKRYAAVQANLAKQRTLTDAVTEATLRQQIAQDKGGSTYEEDIAAIKAKYDLIRANPDTVEARMADVAQAAEVVRLERERTLAALESKGALAELNHSTKGYLDAQIQILQISQALAKTDEERAAIARKLQDAQARKDGDRWYAAKDALSSYADSATDKFANMQNLATSTARNMEDGFVNAFTGSKNAFSDMADSIWKDIVRLQVRENITGPLSGWISGGGIGSLFSSIFHDGGIVGQTAAPGRMVSPDVFAGAPRFHNGLAPDEFPAILQAGEEVIPRGGRKNSSGGDTQTVTIYLKDSQGNQLAAPQRFDTTGMKNFVLNVVRDANARGVAGFGGNQ